MAIYNLISMEKMKQIKTLDFSVSLQPLVLVATMLDIVSLEHSTTVERSIGQGGMMLLRCVHPKLCTDGLFESHNTVGQNFNYSYVQMRKLRRRDWVAGPNSQSKKVAELGFEPSKCQFCLLQGHGTNPNLGHS